MKLLQFAYSPFAAKVRAVLKVKQLKYELVEVPFMDRRELVSLSGDVYVPVLVDGTHVVSDSPRIVSYLDEKGGPKVGGGLGAIVEQWAEGVLEDAAFRFACPGIEDGITALNGGRTDVKAMFKLVKERRYGAGCIEAWRRDSAKYEAQTLELLAPTVQTLASRPFLLGDSFSVADAAVFGQLAMIEWTRPNWVRVTLPSLVDWYERVRA